jgi:uncharacterized protein (DUF885 family)
MTKNKFEGLLDRYFEKLLEDMPMFAVTYGGLRSGEGKLDQSNARFLAHRETERQKALTALETISPRDLDNEQQLDRLALRSHLLKESEDYARRRHELEPNAPDQLLHVLLHELMRGDDEPRRAAANLRSLLKQAPEFLREASTLVKTPDPVWLRVMEQAVAGGLVLADSIGQFLTTVEPGSETARDVGSLKRALEQYRDRAKERKLAPAGSFAIGAETLQRRVRDELGLDYTLGQVEALALGEAERIGKLLRQAASRFRNAGSVDQIIATLRADWKPAKPLIELYREETAKVARGFKAAHAMTFPKGDELEIKPVPEFLRTVIPSAAYTQPGAFEKRQRGVFWVNDLSETKKTASEKLAEQQQHFGLPLTCAHEAYPGHHLQFVTANRHPRRWRRLFAHAVFYEGWTLWCEQMMADLKIDRSPWLVVQQLHDALWRCHRILVDLRLQTRRYSYDQAVRHMRQHVGFTRARAEADVNWYTGQPGVPMSYWLGRLENERLRQRLMVGRGWSLQQFNDWLLSFGTIPQAWIEKYGLG